VNPFEPVFLPPVLLLHGSTGAIGEPGFPAPLYSSRGRKMTQSSGGSRARMRTRGPSHTHVIARHRFGESGRPDDRLRRAIHKQRVSGFSRASLEYWIRRRAGRWTVRTMTVESV